MDPGPTSDAPHLPAMVREVTEFLRGRRLVVDMTLGAGGHSEALLEAGVDEVVGIDRDPEAVRVACERLGRFAGRFRAGCRRFSEVADVREGSADGVLYDLGVSSMQLDTPERGFSFRSSGPLDMRMGPDAEAASVIVNGSSEEDLSRIIWEYGQERQARRIARAIVRARGRAPLETTDQLASVVASAAGRRKGGPHPARRTFQALRIAVNRELQELDASLPRAVELLAPGGRIVVIAYHSLEDGIVKRYFSGEARLAVATKHPLRASPEEVSSNPRARSARLRAADLATEAA